MNSFTHLDARGAAHMVDVSDKNATQRSAKAEAWVVLGEALIESLRDARLPKGDVLAAARVAGIMAAKATSNLIPLCHPLPLSKVTIDFDLGHDRLRVVGTCRLEGKTGVEMEALTAVSVAALTIYDMCKSLDKGIEICRIRLLEKTGGKSGDWHAEEEA